MVAGGQSSGGSSSEASGAGQGERAAGSRGGSQGKVYYRRGVRLDLTDLGDIESSNAWVREGDDEFWDVALRYAGDFGGIRIAATADGAAAGSTVDPGEWLTFTYPSSQSSEVARLLAQAGIEVNENNACRDKAPGPFLDWSDPDVESKYRSGSSGPEAFILRLP